MANPLLNFFGFSIKKPDGDRVATSVVNPDTDDGSIVTNQLAGHNVLGNTYMLAFDQDGQIKNEIDLIRRYREIARFPEISEAINDIVNEAIVIDDNEAPVKLNLDNVKVSDALKRKILAEFEVILSKLNFREEGHELFEKWYVDGKVYVHIILDAKTQNGITELRMIDPRKIKKIKNLIKGQVASGSGAVEVIKEIQEYYLYNDKGIVDSTTQGVRLSPDSVVYCHSGLIDPLTGLVQSHLHKAIRPANQLKMLEEAVVIYRYTRAPERRVFYIDVGNLPKGKAEQYVSDMMNKFKNKLSYDVVTGDIADSKRHLCMDMNTRVPLLDGRTLTIAEIADEMSVSNKQLWAYSCDPITGKFAPGKITWAGVTRPNTQVMKITLDNGQTITCTPDHKFPTWSRGLVKAEDLCVGESMIPHYKRQHPIARGANKNYEQIFENESGAWKFTHRLVSNWKDQIGLDNEFVFKPEFAKNGLHTVHHVNINRFDNTPENLIRMDNEDYTQFNGQDVGRIISAEGFNGFKHLKESLSFRNHKIAKIEWLDERMDTGCLTIDGDEEFHNYHTFALEAGIYTRNQMMEDFWMPRRGDKQTEITTLPGGTGLGDLSDLDYFKDKLYRSLNVPKSRFTPDQGFSIGRSDTISRDEIKFSKFIQKIRNKFSNVFLDILRVQLISRGVFTNKDWEQFKSDIRIEFNIDNHFAELKENEIFNTRVQTALQLDAFVGRYVSKAYVQKQVLKFTDIQIKDMDKEIEEERASDPQPDADQENKQ